MSLTIGKLAKRAGLTARTLRHYDQIGLLRPSRRTEGGYRLYTRDDVLRLHRILTLKYLGCDLAEIRGLLDQGGPSPRELLSRHIQALDARMEQARELRDRLARLLERVEKDGADDADDANGAEKDASKTRDELGEWLDVLERMRFYEKHLSREELAVLRQWRDGASAEAREAPRRLFEEARAAMAAGVRPESPVAHELGRRWLSLGLGIAGDDPLLALKLKELSQREEGDGSCSADMVRWLSQALADKRMSLLRGRLSAEELATFRAGLAEHGQALSALAAELLRFQREGRPPEAPEVGALIEQWDALFQRCCSGGDSALAVRLAAKLRATFLEEPELSRSMGLHERLIEYLRQVRARAARGETMNHKAPKPTALQVARYRAAHQLLDAPVIFEDPFALPILGPEEEAALRADLARHAHPLLKALRASVAARSRVAEDAWLEARGRGVRQCVILGAGLDTLAYRMTETAETDETAETAETAETDEPGEPGETGETSGAARLSGQAEARGAVGLAGARYFEVDLPETLEWKRARLAAASIPEPGGARYAPVDFERETLAEALARAGFDAAAPAFFSWLGVTMYLEPAAVFEVLGFVASLPAGAELVFDYPTLPSLLDERGRKALEFLSKRTAERGEPWKSFFDPSELAHSLKELGFTTVEDLGPEALNERYFSGRSDGLSKSGVSRIMLARKQVIKFGRL